MLAVRPLARRLLLACSSVPSASPASASTLCCSLCPLLSTTCSAAALLATYRSRIYRNAHWLPCAQSVFLAPTSTAVTAFADPWKFRTWQSKELKWKQEISLMKEKGSHLYRELKRGERPVNSVLLSVLTKQVVVLYVVQSSPQHALFQIAMVLSLTVS